MEFEDLEQQAKVLQDENARLQQVLGLAAADDDDDDGEEANGDEEEGQGTDDESEMTGGEEEEYEDDLRDEVSVAGAMQHLAGGVYEPVYHTISPSPYDPGLHGSSTTSISMPPVNPAEIRRALALNLQYREILRQQLKSIEAARARNADYQKRIKALIAQSQKKTARKPGKRSFTAPYFATTSGAVPPDNRDAARRRLYLKSLPNGFKFKKWNQNEEKALAAGVRTANQGILWSRMMENSHAKTSEELRTEGDRIKNMTTDELLENLHGLDWDVIAKVHVPTRSAMDCKIQWTQVQHPSIPKGDRKSKFVKSEDTRLLALANAHKGHDWEAIASELGTGRTPAQCFQRYQRSLNTNIMKTKWTKEEDQQLIEAVRQWGQKNWQQVAHCLTDRTGQQCLHRWQKTLNPEIRRGRWTPAEDMMLTMAVKAYADNLRWVKVQAHVPGRTDVQCRERWVNILNPALNNGPWTEEEDEKLRQAVAAFPTGKWAEISRMLAPRTDNQCWRRWKTLAGEEVEIYRKNVHKKRKGLINNFVGREKERPDLTVADFELNEPPQQPRKRRPSTPEEATSTLPPSDASSTNGDSTSTSTSTSATPSSVPPEGAAPLPGLMILPLEDSGRRSADESTPAAGTATARGTGAKRGRKRKEPSAEEADAAPTTPAKRGRKKKTPDENGGAATPVAASTAPTAATAAAAGAAAAPPGPRKRGRPRKVVAPPAPAPVPAPAPAPSPAPTESREGAQEAETQSDKTAGEETPEAEPLKTPASTTNLRRSTRSTRSKKKTND